VAQGRPHRARAGELVGRGGREPGAGQVAVPVAGVVGGDILEDRGPLGAADRRMMNSYASVAAPAKTGRKNGD
jgi:hypothetical protein